MIKSRGGDRMARAATPAPGEGLATADRVVTAPLLMAPETAVPAAKDTVLEDPVAPAVKVAIPFWHSIHQHEFAAAEADARQ